MAEKNQKARIHGLINKLLHDKLVPELLDRSNGHARENGKQTNQLARFEFHKPDIITFSNLLLDNNLPEAHKAIETYLKNGCTTTHLILGLLSGAARHLGDMWCTDECSFADVTVGLATLHQLLRSLDDKLAVEISEQQGSGAILLTTIPKDTHIFGVAVLDRFFTSNGWHSQALLDPTQGQILQAMARQHFDVVGLSVSCTHDLDQCKTLIRLIRECSQNPDIKIMVGGNLFIERPELVDAVNADVSATNALEALHIATSFYDQEHHHNRDTSHV